MFRIFWNCGPHGEPPRAEPPGMEAFEPGIACSDFRSGLTQTFAIGHIVDYSVALEVASGRGSDPFRWQDVAAR